MKNLGKIIKIFFLIIFALILITAVGAFIFLKNFDVKKYKSQITKIAAEATGRTVDFKDIDLKVSLKEGIRLHLIDFILGEDPNFGEEPFLSTHQIDVGVDILSFFHARQISVPSILIDAPRINIVRNEKGILNAQSMIEKNKTAAEASQSSNTSGGLPAIFINSLKIQNAEIHLLDKSAQPEVKLSIEQLNITVSRFSLIDPFEFLVEAAVLSPQKNIRISGNAQLKLLAKQVNLSNIDLTADLNSLALADLRAMPLLKGIPLPEMINGQLKTHLKELSVSDKGINNAFADIDFTDGKIIYPNLVPGISLDASKINLKIENLSLDGKTPFQISLQAALFQDNPNINLKGSLSFDLKTSQIHLNNTQFSTDLSLWPFAILRNKISALQTVTLPEKLSGQLQVVFKELEASPSGITKFLMDADAKNVNIKLTGIVPDSSLEISQTDLVVQNFSFNQPFSVSLKSGIFNDVQNLSFNGQITYNDKTQSITLDNTSAAIDLGTVSLDRLRSAKIVPPESPFPEVLAGKIETTIKNLSASPKGLENIKADLSWKNGKIFVPQAADGMSIAAQDINVSINDFSLNQPFALDGSLAYENEIPNLAFKSRITLSSDYKNITLTDTTVSSDLSHISFDRLRSAIPSLKNISLPEKLEGQFQFSLTQATVGPKGLTSFSGEGSLKNSLIKMKELRVPVTGLDTNFHITPTEFTMDAIKAHIGQGQITAQLGIKDYLSSQAVNVQAELKEINLAEILDQDKASVKAEGLINGQFKAQGQASNLNSITGDGTFDIQQAKLKDINVLKMVLDKISFIPNISERLQQNLPEKYKQNLENKDTAINKASFTCNIADGLIAIDPTDVEADEFIINGKTLAGFDQKYTFDGAFKIPAELSAAMAEGVEELAYLYDDMNNISFPIHVKGEGAEAPVLSVTQTAVDMTKNAIRNKGKEELRKVLGDVFGTKSTQPDPNQPQQKPDSQQQPSPQEQSPEEQIIGGILNTIFK